jgi:hypothetical protein
VLVRLGHESVADKIASATFTPVCTLYADQPWRIQFRADWNNAVWIDGPVTRLIVIADALKSTVAQSTRPEYSEFGDRPLSNKAKDRAAQRAEFL